MAGDPTVDPAKMPGSTCIFVSNFDVFFSMKLFDGPGFVLNEMHYFLLLLWWVAV